MAIRQIGGAPVYVIDVETPKPTDSRGKGYGLLVSDLRWRLWEEVQQSQLQQMKFDQLNRQAQLDVLEQQQRDISRAIRDANEQKAKIKAGTVSSGGAAKALGYVSVKQEPNRDPFTGEIIPGTITTTTTKRPLNIVQGAAGSKEALEQQKAQFEQQQADLDAYISELETQQSQLGQRFGELAGQPVGKDILSRTREAYQSQIGEGGFGISRRPLRQVPTFNEAEAVGRVQDTIAREEQNLLNEAVRRRRNEIQNRITELDSLTEGEMTGALLADLKNQLVTGSMLSSDEERRIKELARSRVAEQMTAAGAEPTSRAGFLMKPPPPYEPLLPRESTTVPTGRFRDEFGVESSAPLSREQEVLRDINRGVDVYPELQDIRAVREATTSPKGQGDFQLNQRLQDIVSNQNLSLEDAALEIERARNEARKFEIQRQLDEARLASERGFPTPVQNISGFQQGVMGRPGGIADRRVVRKLPETVPMPEEEINFGGGVVPVQPEGPEIVPEEPAAIPPETKNNRTPERAPLPPMDENLPESPYEPQGKLSTTQRRDIYAMKTVKQGLELAEKPKQFARLAKTDSPDKAPEYVKIVNGIYDINSAKPNRFKLSYDEISKAFKDDPATRQKAHAYLVAKDTLESNVQNPLA